MADENWQKMREIFDSALRRKPEERRKYVHEACGEDTILLHEVESLLSSLDGAESFMETPAVTKVADIIEAETKTLEIGKCFGHFEIIEQIGAGGMGEVYLAEDKKLDRRVAVKILNEKFSRDESSLKRFVQEAKAASALNHPNILVIHEIGESDEAHFIVSEFVKGVTLREMFKGKAFKLSESLDIFIQIANALTAAHEVHLVHRDIKPENIMIRPDGFVKVLDFGLAKLVEQNNKSILGLEDETVRQNQTAKGVIMGTVNYMSPEQAKGERVEERTDIFSFGAVIYEMIAGKTPFAGDSVSETFANLINQEPQPLVSFASNVPNELQRIVSKMLRKNKTERFQTMKDVFADLKDLRENLTLEEKLERTASPDGKPTEILKLTTGDANLLTAKTQNSFSMTVKRHKPLAAFALAALLVGVVGLGYYFLNRSKTRLVFQAGQVIRLTSNGKVKTAAVSPDGNFTIYAQEENAGRQSLWMRHIASESNVQIVASAAVEYRVLSITPDGNSIYFVDEKQSVYQIPVLGGTAKKIAEGLLQNSGIGFSPDSKRFTFLRRFENNSSVLFTINADGTNEQKVVSIESPMKLQDDPAWSPNGKIIACPILIDGFFKILAVQLADGKTALISPDGWSVIRKLAWLPDSNSLAFIGTVKGNYHQLFQISYPGGEARQITSDLYNYDDFSLTSDASSLTAVKVEQTAHLWITPSGDVARAQEITSGFEKFDGIYSLDWMSENKLLYTSSPSDDVSIWTIETDGGNPKQLLKSGHYPAISPDHHFIVYRERLGAELTLLKMDLSDGSEKALTTGVIHYPTFSPDGKWLVFTKYNDSIALWKVSSEGGEATRILAENALCAAVSPDGKTITFILRKGGNPNRIALVSFDGGEIIKLFDAVPETYSFSNNQNLQWTPDGRGIYFIALNNGVSNIWRQPIDGSPPVQVTKFDSGRIFNFAYSSDGKQLVLSRGSLNSDVVLIKNSK